jgi:uncharacterized protein (TIGR01244 family)
VTGFWKLCAAMVVTMGAAVAGGCATVGSKEAGIENFDKVSATVYRGAQPTREGFKTLAGYEVKTVINLRSEDDSAERAMAKEAGMKYVSLPMDADTVTAADAEKFLALLATVPAPVFVHCHAGRDRTGMAVAAYRVQVEHWTREAAVREMKAHGHYWMLYPKVGAAVAAVARAVETEGKVLAVAGKGTGAAN